MAERKYASMSSISYLVDNIMAKFSKLGHKHTSSDITDLKIPTKVSELTNDSGYVPNTRTVNGKALSSDITLAKSDVGLGNVDNTADSAKSVKYATSADTATNATSAGSATKATQDASGNVITSTYETKADATAKLAEAKTYADGVKNSLLNGAGAAYDTLSELATLIDENTDAIDALEIVATGKADKTHDHTITASASDDDVVVLTGTNGTNKVTYSASHANSGVTAGTYRSVTVNAKGHVTAGTNPTTLAGYGITDVYTKAEVDAAIAAAIAAALNVDTTTEV